MKDAGKLEENIGRRPNGCATRVGDTGRDEE